MAVVAGGRLVAWIAFAFGSVMSIAANVLHAWLQNDTPTLAVQVGAAVWPVALLLSVEVLSRVQWPNGWQWLLARYGGVGAVGVCSAIISYGHVYEVLMEWGYGDLGATVGPIVLDGLMVISGFALLAPSVRKSPAVQILAVDERGPDVLRAGAPHPVPTPPVTVPAATPKPVTTRKAATSTERTDDELLTLIRGMADKAGAKPTGRQVRALGVGPDRAKRLLEEFDRTGPRRTA